MFFYRLLLTSIILAAGFSVPALAEDRVAFNPPVDPDGDLDSPGGGTRGDGCYSFAASRSASLIALSPRNAQLAQTQAAQPKFRVFVASSDAKYGVFTLQDREGRVHYRAEAIALPAKGGMVTIDLPSEVELAPNQTYHWFLEVLCSGSIDPNNPIAEGQVQRVASSPAGGEAPSEIDFSLGNPGVDAVPNILSQVEVYRQSNLWYEAIDILAIARQTYPGDDRLNQSWYDLLELAGITPLNL
ncbi:MAG: DUF928 domain-containing protein [Oscillatoriales cyanobacterium]|jgi:Domain of Unknown Function (DUF928)|nr:MAG: DUF928 domain-containing protein [Oscillatoriales cyanobacterium]